MNRSEQVEGGLLFSKHISYLQDGYEKALAIARLDAVVVHAGQGIKQRVVDDQYWPLKINPTFAHWLPLLEPGALVIIRPGHKAMLIRPQNASFWEGPAPVPGEHFWEEFEVVEAARDQIREHIPQGRVGFVGDFTKHAEALGIDEAQCNPPVLLRELDALRTRKTEYEIGCLTEASRIAAQGHASVDLAFHQGFHSELDLHLQYLRITKQDATETPYGNIVAQGPNAAILHHVHYNRDVDSNSEQSLLVDAGTNYMGYASDITRTTVRGRGQAASDFRALIAGLDTIERELCAAVKPGLAYEALHDLAHEKLAELLVESRLCQGSTDALVAQGVTRAFFPHGLGHSLGLQVHDVGCKLQPPSERNPFLRNTSIIEQGQVFTIEPGCYFIEGLLGPLKASTASKLVSWPTVDKMRPFGGIRIEDNLVVTKTGSINLTRDNWPTS